MKNLIEDWKSRKGRQKKQHRKFIQKLKRHRGKHLDRLAEDIHERVFEKLDCLDCANCCSSIPPIVNKTDANRIAKYLGMKIGEFERKYLTIDEDEDVVMNQSPCPFLEQDNRCQIYEVRPKACREYPHTDGRQFSQKLSYHAPNAQYCPASFQILEEMMRSVPT